LSTSYSSSHPQRIQVHTEEYQEELVPYSGNLLLRKYRRGPRPPYAILPAPQPNSTTLWSLKFDTTLGLYFWKNNLTKKQSQVPPESILPLFFEPEPSPPATESDEEEEDEEFREPEEHSEHYPLLEDPVQATQEQENPLVTATTPVQEFIPYSFSAPVFQTPITGPSTFIPRSLKKQDLESSDNLAPRPTTTSVNLHPFLGLPSALRQPPPANVFSNALQLAVLANMAGAAQAAAPQPPAPVTLDQLRTQMNKLKGTTVSFSGKEDPHAFKNKMALLI